jgi:hypothetical protein
MRRPMDARATRAATPLLLLASLASLLGACLLGCDRNDEPVAAQPPSAESATHGPFKPAREKPLLPPIASAADSAAAMLPRASREPDMGLDAKDPAKDYVARYLKATKRYGANAACVVTMPSTFKDNTDVVETHNDSTGSCGKADELRDRFFVSVTTDHMTIDPSLHQPKLQSWPDGSDPDGPAGKVGDVQDLRHWKTGLRDAFHKLQLAPLRVQLYGRGTYPIVSIAGWHGPVLRTMTADELEGPAKALCEANDGNPLGVFAALDRSTLLRITCHGGARFDAL